MLGLLSAPRLPAPTGAPGAAAPPCLWFPGEARPRDENDTWAVASSPVTMRKGRYRCDSLTGAVRCDARRPGSLGSTGRARARILWIPGSGDRLRVPAPSAPGLWGRPFGRRGRGPARPTPEAPGGRRRVAARRGHQALSARSRADPARPGTGDQLKEPIGTPSPIGGAPSHTADRAAPRPRERTSHGSRDHAPAPPVRCPLRAPDPPVEPQDEALHPHRAQRHLRHRPHEVRRRHQHRLRLRQGDRRPRRQHPLRRHQEAGAGRRGRAGPARRHALRQPALAGRHAHQLLHRARPPGPHEGASSRSTSTTWPAPAARRRSCS